MKTKYVLISGPTIVLDMELEQALHECAVILKNADNRRALNILQYQMADLLLMETTKNNSSEIAIMKQLKQEHPQLTIILIDGDNDLIAKTFEVGVKDVFRKPYKTDLVAERIRSLTNNLFFIYP